MPYHAPPPNYSSPAEDGCAVCGKPISYIPILGGHKWSHVSLEDHDVVLRGPWWDTRVGGWRAASHILVRTAFPEFVYDDEEPVAIIAPTGEWIPTWLEGEE